jgi:hypothetical protein
MLMFLSFIRPDFGVVKEGRILSSGSSPAVPRAVFTERGRSNKKSESGSECLTFFVPAITLTLTLHTRRVISSPCSLTPPYPDIQCRDYTVGSVLARFWRDINNIN